MTCHQKTRLQHQVRRTAADEGRQDNHQETLTDMARAEKLEERGQRVPREKDGVSDGEVKQREEEEQWTEANKQTENG